MHVPDSYEVIRGGQHMSYVMVAVANAPVVDSSPAVIKGIAAGLIEAGGELILESQMPSGGVIFSDGVEAMPSTSIPAPGPISGPPEARRTWS